MLAWRLCSRQSEAPPLACTKVSHCSMLEMSLTHLCQGLKELISNPLNVDGCPSSSLLSCWNDDGQIELVKVITVPLNGGPCKGFCLHTQDKLNSWKTEKCGWNIKIYLKSCALEHPRLLPQVAFIASKTSRTEEHKASPSPCRTETLCLTLSLLCLDVFGCWVFFFLFSIKNPNKSGKKKKKKKPYLRIFWLFSCSFFHFLCNLHCRLHL